MSAATSRTSITTKENTNGRKVPCKKRYTDATHDKKISRHQHESLQRVAINTFIKAVPNELGNAAYEFDNDGVFYNATTEHPHYTPRSGDEKLMQEAGENITNRMNNTKRMIIIGGGPGAVFENKEGTLIRQVSSINEILLIEPSASFSAQQAAVIQKIAEETGRTIKSNTLTMTFQEAAAKHPTLNGRETIVVCTGGLIMNTATTNHDTFPEAEFTKDMQAIAKLAGMDGRILVSYVSDADQHTIKRPYKTEAFRNMYLQVIEQISRHVKEFKELRPENFTVSTLHNKAAQSLQHYLVAKKPMSFEVTYKNGGGKAHTHKVNLFPGDRIPIIPSYRPNVDYISNLIEKSVFSPGPLRTTYNVSDAKGATLHLMSVGPKI